MRTPAYTLVIDGQAITAKISPRLVSLSLTDKRGLEADELELVLTDHDGLLAIPEPNATLALAIGWTDALTDKGTYVVDEVEHAGAPDQLSIRARSADFREGSAAKRSQSYHQTTVEAIVAAVAARQGLTPVTAAALASKTIAHLDQEKESDWHFLTRLAERYDAIATVKAGRLLFFPRGASRTAGGTALPGVVLTRREGDNHRWSLATRDAYAGVIAEWHDRAAGERKEVVVGEEDGAKRLRSVYDSEQEAWDAATSEHARLQRGTAELAYTLAEGRADLTPETPLTVSGLKPAIDGTAWIITEVRHRIDDGGFVTELTAERATDPSG